MDFCTCKGETAALTLAIATVPKQPWVTPYDLPKGLTQGTIFPNLDLPFYVTAAGGEHLGR